MNEKQRRGEDIPLADVKEGRWQRGRAEEGSSHESMEASICRWRLQSAAGRSAGRAQEQQQRMVAREPICSVNRRKGRRAEQIGLGLQSADGRTAGAEGDGQSRGGRADGRSRIGGRADGELDAGGAPLNSRFALFSPPSPLFSLSSALSPFPC